jgi:hypothetical protein
MIHDIFDIIRNSLLITGLVMVMMLVIEYINVVSSGKKLQNLQKSRNRQLIVASLLGLVPGCIGGFAVVSLYTHGIVNFGALAAAMIVSLGDEAFILFAKIPETAVQIMALLFVIAIATGFIINIFIKKSPSPIYANHLEIHCHETENIHGSIVKNLQKITFQRATLIAGIIIFVIGLTSGLLDHAHDNCCEHNLNSIFNERWLNILFALLSIITLYIIAKVSNHFLEEHLWGHIIKKHFPKIFLWTLSVLLIIYILLYFINIEEWIANNRISVLFIALFVGLIPESGPHIIFIMLFANGTIPFSILLANSFVQDGHSALPLLAENKKSFFYIKLIKFIIGAMIGFAGIISGF